MSVVAQHTPGPWKIEHSRLCEGHFVISEHAEKLGWHQAVADCCVKIDPNPILGVAEFIAVHRDQIKANAALIASAPDLLAALQGLLRTGTCAAPSEDVLIAARAAIAKAGAS